MDLVVSPISQFAFALLGWTGSKVGTNGFLAILVGVQLFFDLFLHDVLYIEIKEN